MCLSTPLRWQSTSSSASSPPATSRGNKAHQQAKREPRGKPAYYNFATQNQFLSTNSGRVPRRLSAAMGMSPAIPDDHLPMENTAAVDESDPYKHIRIFRRDMVDAQAARNLLLSVDVPVKKFTDMFCDYDGRRCKLCNETFHQWHSHQNCIPHSGREGLALELVRAFCGSPEEIVKMWWYRLHTSPMFDRIPELSSDNSHERKRRLQYLLHFLKDRRILVDAFSVMQNALAGAGRSWEFERLEWVGDNVVKYVLNNRINCVFPVREGGVRSRLGYFQFVMDGNDGLARSYDYLELQKLTESGRVVSKFKSDVVETLFGELQLYLWSTELHLGTERYALPFTSDMYAVRAIVSHVMEELAHVVFMYHAEYVLGAVQRIVRENQLQFVRANPALRRAAAANADAQGDVANPYGGGRRGGGGGGRQAGTGVVTGTGATLSLTRVQPNHARHGASLYLESVNYDGFKRVVPLGGLLPRPFAPAELAATATYLPQLQECPELARRLPAPQLWGKSVLQDGASSTNEPDAAETESVVEDEKERYRLSNAPTAAPVTQTTTGTLSVPELKDHCLVPELI